MNYILMLSVKNWGPLAYIFGKIFGKNPEVKRFMNEVSDFVSDCWPYALCVLYAILALFLVYIIVRSLYDVFKIKSHNVAILQKNKVEERNDEQKRLLTASAVSAIVLIISTIGMMSLDLFPGKPEINISNSWIETDVTRNNETGCVIHFDCEAHNLKDRSVTVSTSFFDSEGNNINNNALKLENKKIPVFLRKQLGTTKRRTSFKITEKDMSLSNLQYFIPYTAINFKEGKQQYSYIIEIFDITGQRKRNKDISMILGNNKEVLFEYEKVIETN